MASERFFALDHTVDVRVPVETLFDYLVSPDLLARWLAPGAVVEPRIDGEVRVPQPDGSVAGGRVIAVRTAASSVVLLGLRRSGRRSGAGRLDRRDHTANRWMTTRRALP